MCCGCWNEYGRHRIENAKTIAVARLIDRLYDEYSGAGGRCHIVVDDWNLEDSSIRWCLDNLYDPEIYAKYPNEDPHDEEISHEILTRMLAMSMEERCSVMAIHDHCV